MVGEIPPGGPGRRRFPDPPGLSDRDMRLFTSLRRRVGSRLQHKLMLLVLAVVSVIVLIPSVVGIRASIIDERVDREVEEHSKALIDTQEMEHAIRREQLAVDSLAFAGDSAAVDEFATARDDLERAHSAVLAQAARDIRHSDEQADEIQELLETCRDDHEAIGETFTGIIVPLFESDPSSPQLRSRAVALEDETEALNGKIREIEGFFQEETADARNEQAKAVTATRTATWVSTVIAVILGLVLAWFFSRRLTRRVMRLKRAAGEMAGGSLDSRVDVGGYDELARLGASFNSMAESLEQGNRTLEETEARTRAIHQSLSDGIIILGKDGKITSVNPAAEVALGRPVTELEGRHGTGVPELDRVLAAPPRSQAEMVRCWVEKQCTHPDCPSYESEDRRCWLQCGTHCYNQIQGTFRQKRDACARCDVFKANAVIELEAVAIGEKYFDIVVSPLLDDQGQDEGRTIVLRDITGAKQAGEDMAALDSLGRRLTASMKREEILEAIIESALEALPAEGAVIHLREGQGMRLALERGLPATVVEEERYLEDSGSCCSKRPCNDSKVELIDDLQQDGRAHAAAAAAGLHSYLRAPLVSKRRVIGSLTLVSGRTGAFSRRHAGLLAVMGDRAGLALANQELFDNISRAKTEWETTFDSAGEGIMVVNDDHRITRLNRTAAEMLGGSVEEITGRNCHELVHHTGEPPDDCLMRAARHAEGSARGEEETADGRTLEVMVDIIRDGDGKAEGSIHFLRDITEDKRLRQQLQQSEKMVSVGQLVSGVAHELNNPLTGITGYAQLLAMKDLPAEVRKDIESISHEADRAARIVRNLLSFAREHKLERKQVQVNSIVAETLELKAYDLKVNNIEVKTDLAADLPVTWADPHQLQQVFLNLISNAEQAMLAENSGGCLRVNTGLDGGRIWISFADNGSGVPEEIKARIFDPFFTTKGVGKGTGLGLSICYGIMQEHGGDIRLGKAEGGAEFVVEVPVVSNSETEGGGQQPGTLRPDSARTGRILLVDDEAVIRDMLARTLSRSGHMVETARNGRVALRMLTQEHYDCIVSDVRMPDMDGAALHRAIRERDSEQAGRFIFITGDTVNPGTREYLEQVDNPRLAKPFSSGELLQELERILSRN